MSGERDPKAADIGRDRRTLGEIKVEAFEQDVLINDRQQAFSAELSGSRCWESVVSDTWHLGLPQVRLGRCSPHGPRS